MFDVRVNIYLKDASQPGPPLCVHTSTLPASESTSYFISHTSGLMGGVVSSSWWPAPAVESIHPWSSFRQVSSNNPVMPRGGRGTAGMRRGLVGEHVYIHTHMR